MPRPKKKTRGRVDEIDFEAGFQTLDVSSFEEEQMPKKTKKKPEEFDVKFKNPLGESNDAEQDAKQTEEPQLSPKKLSKKGKKNGSEKKKGPSGKSSTGLMSEDFLTLSQDSGGGGDDGELRLSSGKKNTNGGQEDGGSKKKKSKGKNGKKGKKKDAPSVDQFLAGIADGAPDEPAPDEPPPPTHDIARLKKKSVQKLQKKAVKRGVDEGAILDAGNSKNKLIDLIVNGATEDDQTWAQKATVKREKEKAASSSAVFRQKSSVNMDFHTFESDAPDGAKLKEHFATIEEGDEVRVVDYWIDDPTHDYVPCTAGDDFLDPTCILYSLTCPCFWRVAYGGLPTWDNPEPDPDDLQQMLVYDDVNSKRIYILAPRPGEALHSVQCRNACMYQKLHHPIISIVTTHQFNEFSKFEKIMVFILGYFLACFLTEGMEKARGLELEEFIGIPAIATFMFFKLFTAIASVPADLMILGFPYGKFMDLVLPLAIRAAFCIFVLGMAYGAWSEQRLVILNLCMYTDAFHDGCDETDELDEITLAAIIDLLKGMFFEFVFGFTLIFRPRWMRFELFGFCPPSIPGEMYSAHHRVEFINERGNTDYLSAWKKPWTFGDKGRALVNWMEIRPETKKVAERQKELYIKGAEYAKEQDKKKSIALAKEVDSLMSVEEVDRQLLRTDMKRANQMHEATKLNALELLKTTLENINNELTADVQAAEDVVPNVEADIKAEIKAVRRDANLRANEAGPGFFDRGIFFNGQGRKTKLAAVKAIRDEAAADVEHMQSEGIQRVKVATSKSTAARIAADDKWLQNTHAAHKRLKALEDEAYDVYEANLSAAEKASEKRTKKQRAKADKAEAQADAAAAEMEAKREREAALDRNKDRLREENRTKLEARLEQLLEGEAQMSLERKRDQWLTALIETGEKHIAAKAGAGTWKHVTPPDNLWLEGSYEGMPIAELHAKVDEAMGNLAEAYRQRDGAKRHKQVMIQIATPKHTPKRRQKKLRKAAEERIAAATVEGDATIAKMHENILSWKGVTLCGLEKMAAQQDEMMKAAEIELENLQERAKETAQIIMGFGGKILDIIEMAKFQEPERVAQDKRKAEQKQRAAEEADLAKKKLKKKEKKKDGEEVEEEEEEISLTEPLIKALRGTEILTELMEKEKKRDKSDRRKAAAEEAEEARRLALSKLVKQPSADVENPAQSPKKGGSSNSPTKGDASKKGGGGGGGGGGGNGSSKKEGGKSGSSSKKGQGGGGGGGNGGGKGGKGDSSKTKGGEGSSSKKK